MTWFICDGSNFNREAEKSDDGRGKPYQEKQKFFSNKILRIMIYISRAFFNMTSMMIQLIGQLFLIFLFYRALILDCCHGGDISCALLRYKPIHGDMKQV